MLTCFITLPSSVPLLLSFLTFCFLVSVVSILTGLFWFYSKKFLLRVRPYSGGKSLRSVLGTTLPGFRSCNPPWLRLSERLSPHSVCKKSPNLLAALLPLPDLSLKQCQRWVQPCAGKGRFPWAIRPKKECVKSCETWFANTLNLNDKGPSMKCVCSPKVLWPFSYLTLTQNKPSEFITEFIQSYHYCLTMIDKLYIYALYSYTN